MTHKPKLVALFGWKYEPEWMVEELKENLAPFVDDFCILDDRNRTHELWRHEGEYRKILRKMAFEKKADWVLITSPDERFDDNAKDIIPKLLNTHKPIVYTFPLREMYTPDSYRVDGIWGRKVRPRLYRLKHGQQLANKRIQSRSYPNGLRKVHVDVNIYHLKHIEPENRVMRAEVFKQTDPDNKFQRIGYDYLADETGIEMQKINVPYSPFYTKKYIFTVPDHFLNNKNHK
jgi:hypothetical protein